MCKPGSLDPKKVNGKILVCLLGNTTPLEQGHQAALLGAVGMIVANDIESGNEIWPEAHFLPTSNINYTDGKLVLDYLNSTK